MALVKDGLEQLGDSTLTSAQRQAVLTSLSGYRQNIRDLSTWNAATLQLASVGKTLTADDVQAANTGISTSDLIETNEKTVNDVYLETVGKDVDMFTTDQTSALFNIANQCPMLGGNAVFKARSLYWLIDDAYDFDDAALCLPYGIIVKNLTEQHAHAVSVVPNPAKDEATLVLTREIEVPAWLTLYNAVGSEVLPHARTERHDASSIHHHQHCSRLIPLCGIVKRWSGWQRQAHNRSLNDVEADHTVLAQAGIVGRSRAACSGATCIGPAGPEQSLAWGIR
ncbi:MAG: hypothetical protein IPM68_16710 [Flavobacteriales bacterium]|nr:hypothetical protein [Flavobacteriales bacterium]